MPSSRKPAETDLFTSRRPTTPDSYLVAHIDGGARGNPGPAGYGVVIKDQSGRKVAARSEYLGHQTNNFAEYQGLIAALEYALAHGPKALKVISDSELLVRQIKLVFHRPRPARAQPRGRRIGKRSHGQRHGTHLRPRGASTIAPGFRKARIPKPARARRDRSWRSRGATGWGPARRNKSPTADKKVNALT